MSIRILSTDMTSGSPPTRCLPQYLQSDDLSVDIISHSHTGDTFPSSAYEFFYITLYISPTECVCVESLCECTCGSHSRWTSIRNASLDADNECASVSKRQMGSCGIIFGAVHARNMFECEIRIVSRRPTGVVLSAIALGSSVLEYRR